MNVQGVLARRESPARRTRLGAYPDDSHESTFGGLMADVMTICARERVIGSQESLAHV